MLRSSIDPVKFNDQLAALAQTYRVICMNAVSYATVRKYGRDQLSCLASTDEGAYGIPFWCFAFKSGAFSAFYAGIDYPEGAKPETSLLEQESARWALIVVKKSIPEGLLRVATDFGEPWVDLPIEA